MSIRLILHGKVKDGMTDAFKAPGADMVAAARNEPGTTTYRWYLSDDGTSSTRMFTRMKLPSSPT